ncbi:MAG: cell division protein ZapA [Pseudomonadota bacterium]
MGEVSVDVAGRNYLVGCEDGEEGHLLELARNLDQEARDLAGRMGQMSEGRLMLMTALIMADRLAEQSGEKAKLQKKLDEAKLAAKQGGVSVDLFADDREAELAAEIDRMAERVEALAASLNHASGRVNGAG